ncbi:arrestin (or S-antigen) like protein [Zymoseptoria brevis]|uniref:Arrestin (Or S-antigen) like protein n=1 Tax=Zymoseptoria brevis TaxID=1047168 RepID=A0A0F4GJV3_9PEZI|nr:arrestin (or S-antigen) like protein [Zymoseptoria brevis]
MATTQHFASSANDAPMQKIRSLYQGNRPDVQIRLNRERSVYTTLDQLDGVVTITCTSDVSFDDVEIEFVGTSRTFVERLTTAAAISGRSVAFHQFLKLQQPDCREQCPADRVFRAGQKYEFPFVFVVPQHLLPRVCQHKVVSLAVRDAHLQLPPTFGDQEHEDSNVSDDMVPEMASIRYGVFARVSKNKTDAEAESKPITIASKAKRLRVIPAHDEQPPLDVDGKDSEYTMRKERSIRKGVLKGKLGTLVMDANQPPSMVLQSHPTSDKQTTSRATIQLRFDPADSSCPPPRIGSLTSRLKVCTYFSSTARHTFPAKSSAITDLSQGMYSEQINLSSRCMAAVEWTKHDPKKAPSRRDSGMSISSTSMLPHPEPSSTYKSGSPYYIAALTVPLTLPSNKSFVPTFHSCLVSRIYQLKFELGLQTAGLGGTLDLKVPFQLSCESTSNGDASPRRGSVVTPAANEEESVDAYFAPRDVTNGPAPAYGLAGGVDMEDAPPGYGSFAPTRVVGTTLPVY